VVCSHIMRSMFGLCLVLPCWCPYPLSHTTKRCSVPSRPRYSRRGFFSPLRFDKEEGKGSERRRETTTVYSIGVTPLKQKPLSIAFMLPMTFSSGAADPSTPNSKNSGFEDTLFSARYRVDAKGMASSLSLDQSYMMGVGGLEMPTGTIDHPF